MKKRYCVWVSLFCALGMLLTGCSTGTGADSSADASSPILDDTTADVSSPVSNEKDYATYVMGITNNSPGVRIEKDYWSALSFQKDGISSRTMTIQEKTFTGEYQNSRPLDGTPITEDFFRTEDGIKFSIDSDTNKLLRVSYVNKTYASTVPFLEDVPSPAEYARTLAFDIASKYIQTDEYELTYDSNEVDGKRDGVDHPYTTYTFTFIKFINGMRTTDSFAIHITSKGNVSYFSMGYVNGFDAFADLTIDKAQVSDAVDAKVKELYENHEQYSYVSHELGDQVLVITPEGRLAVRSFVSLRLALSDSSHVSSGISVITLLPQTNK